MRQVGEPSVEEILASIKNVIARDNRDGAALERRERTERGLPRSAQPATADDAIGGAVLIGKYDNGGSPATFSATADDGVLSKNSGETLSGTSVAAGTMAFFRLVLAADDGSASTSAPRVQGQVGLVGMPVVVPNTVVSASGVTLPPVSALVIRMPKQ